MTEKCQKLYINMDEESWKFFCNNSPRLVHKQRPKTPIEILTINKNFDTPKLLSSNISTSKFSLKAEMIKNSLRSIYRDKTPTPTISKTQSKQTIKPYYKLAPSFYKDSSKIKLSPLRLTKPSGCNLKKSLIRVLKKPEK